MARVKQARIVLYLVALTNIVLIAMSWPHPSKFAGIGTMIVCGGSVILAYREDPTRFHRRVGGTEALRMILASLVFIGIVILLSRTHLI